MVMFFHSGSHKICGSDKKSHPQILQKISYLSHSTFWVLVYLSIKYKKNAILGWCNKDQILATFLQITTNNNTENQPVTDKPSLML